MARKWPVWLDSDGTDALFQNRKYFTRCRVTRLSAKTSSIWPFHLTPRFHHLLPLSHTLSPSPSLTMSSPASRRGRPASTPRSTRSTRSQQQAAPSSPTPAGDDSQPTPRASRRLRGEGAAPSSSPMFFQSSPASRNNTGADTPDIRMDRGDRTPRADQAMRGMNHPMVDNGTLH